MDQSPGPIFPPSPSLPVRENMSYMKPVRGAKKVGDRCFNGTVSMHKIPNALSEVHIVPKLKTTATITMRSITIIQAFENL